MAKHLTQGAIMKISSENFSCSKEFKPVLQAFNCRNTVLSLSDGSHYATAIINNNLTELVTSNKLQNGSIVRLTDFSVEPVDKHDVIINIVDLDVILHKCELIGEPALLPHVDVNLTTDAIATICKDSFSRDDDFKPVLQLFDVSLLQYRRILLSDGWHHNVGIFLGDLEEYSGRLQKGTVVQLTHFVVTKSEVQNSKVIIIIDCDIKLEKCQLIGKPQPPLLKIAPPLTNLADLMFSNSITDRLDKNLTKGAIATIFSENFSRDDEFMPVLQVIDADQLPLRRISLSDGCNHCDGIFLREMHEMFEKLVCSMRLQKGSIVKLTRFVVTNVQNSKVIIIVDLDGILERCEIMGEPVLLPINALSPSVVNLTQEAIGVMCSDNFSRYVDFKPVLQLSEVLLLKDRRIKLSDGCNHNVGIFLSDSEEYSGKLQKGSIVKLTHFVVSESENQYSKVIIIIDFDVILEKWELIGKPQPLPLKIAPPQTNLADPSLSNSIIDGVDKNLTQGAIATVCSDNFSRDDEFNPVLQVIDVHKRHISLSDGFNHCAGIFLREMHEMVEKLVYSMRLQKGSIVKLTRFVVTEVQNSKVIIIIDLDILEERCEMLGETVLLLPIKAPLPPNVAGFSQSVLSSTCECNCAKLI